MAEGLNEIHKEIFDVIDNNDVNGFKNILYDGIFDPDAVDKDGVSPLEKAAYVGNKEIVQTLLDYYEDTNDLRHVRECIALHYAIVKGHLDICEMLLKAGAKGYVTNSFGWTASEMATNLNNHHCAALINNYIHESEVRKYVKSNENGHEAKLQSYIADSFHRLILYVNLNPVSILLFIKSMPELIYHSESIESVLKLMCEREMNKRCQTNESIAFKCHYFSRLIAELSKYQQKYSEESKNKINKKYDYFDAIIKRFLYKKPGKDNKQEGMDAFLQLCIRDFPYRMSAIFCAMVVTLSQKDHESALSVISVAVNGRRFLKGMKSIYCATCSGMNPCKRCSKCKSIHYCGKECQRLHWFVHKHDCKWMSMESLQEQEESKINEKQNKNDDLSTVQQHLIQQMKSGDTNSSHYTCNARMKECTSK